MSKTNTNARNKITSPGISETFFNAENRRRFLRKRYNDDIQFREKKLKAASKKYLGDEEFQANVKNLSKQRYYNDVEYNTKTKERSRRESKIKYATDPDHRHKVKERIFGRYSTDEDKKTPSDRVLKGINMMKSLENE